MAAAHIVVSMLVLGIVAADEYSAAILQDGAFNASKLEHHVWRSGSCGPNAFVDYYVDIDEKNHNLFLAAVHDTEEITPGVLEMFVYETLIPEDRKSERRAIEGSDRSLSVAVNANDLELQRYYVSMKCNADAKFWIITELTDALLNPRAEGHLCRDELLYHYVEKGPVNFRVCADDSVRVVARVGAPPLRVAEPVIYINGNCRDFHICESQILGNEKIWIGIAGGGVCTAYNVTALEVDECIEELGDAKDVATVEQATELKLEHVAYGSCQPYSWVDYVVDLSDVSGENLVFETRDTSDDALNFESLRVSLFTDTIPEDRETENRADRSVSNIYAVFKNYLSLRQLEDLSRVFLSVQCRDNPVSFKIFGERVPAKLTLDHKSRGEVCPGYFIYHYVDTYFSLNLHVAVHAFEGDLVFTVLSSDPPIRIAPPYAEASSSLEVDVTGESSSKDAKVEIPCADKGRYYVGITTTSDACAVYDIEPFLTASSCAEIPRQEAYDTPLEITNLEVQVPENHACSAGTYKLFSFDLNVQENVIIEVEQRTTHEAPEALGVFLYQGSVPADYATELFSDFGSGGIWSVSLSANDVRNGTYYVAVKCWDIEPVSFRIAVLLIQSVVDKRIHGELCPRNYVQHVTTGNVRIYRLSGDLVILPRRDRPPLKLAPPLLSLNEEYVDLSFCDGGTYYIGLVGSGTQCAVYDILPIAQNETCRDFFETYVDSATTQEERIEFDEANYGSVGEGETKTYVLKVDEIKNVIFEVEDVTGLANRGALLLQIFEGDVTERSELRSETAVDDVYSIAIPSTEMREGLWYLTVTGMAAQQIRYRLTIVAIDADVGSKKVQGHLFQGEWLMHRMLYNEGPHYRVSVRKYTASDLYIFPRRSQAPTIVTPPWVYMTSEMKETEFYFCGISDVIDYVGLYATNREVVYDIHVEGPFSECGFTPNFALGNFDTTNSSLVQHLVRPGQRTLASCDEGHWEFFRFLTVPDFLIF